MFSAKESTPIKVEFLSNRELHLIFLNYQQTFPGKVAPAVEVSSSVGHYGVRDHMRTG